MKPYNLETHNGIITVRNPRGEHRTLKIATQRKYSKFAPGKRVLHLLTGLTYRGFAFVEKDEVFVWKRKLTKGFCRLADIIRRPEHYQEQGYEYRFEGRCRVCNSPLTHPDSIDLGIGPVCRKRVAKIETPMLF